MIITTRAVPQGRKNDKDWPEFYTCNFLEPGLVNYADAGAGITLLQKDTILKMLPTFMGKPVIDEMHVDVTPGTYKKHAVGYITKVWYDDYTNWAMCQFILTDDKAKENVAKGYSVSCAYDQVVTGPGGERNAVKYVEEILDGVGNHLALVTSPRYEECKIQPCMMLVNSKKATIMNGEGKDNAKVNYEVMRHSDGTIKRIEWVDKYGKPQGFDYEPDEADQKDAKAMIGTLEHKMNSLQNEVYKGWKIKKNEDGVWQALDDVSGSPRFGSRKLEDVKTWIDRSNGEGKSNTVTVRVVNATKGSSEKQEEAEECMETRICNSCEYLVQGVCQVAGPGGEITQRYADSRLHGYEQECSAYDKTEGRRENFIVVKSINT